MNGVKTVFLMTLMMVLFIFVGNILGGNSGMTIAFIFSLLLNVGSYWYSDKIVLKMYRAVEVERAQFPQLYETVERLSSQAGLPMPKVYVINNPTPNAFATGRNPEHSAVAVTTGIMKMLTKQEIEGVIGHELTHVKNRDILISTITATLVGTITLIARIAGWAALFGGRSRDDGDGFESLILLLLSPVVAVLIQLAISRSREFMADEGSAEITSNPLALASALNKLSLANKQIPMRNAGTSSAHLFIVNPLSGKSLTKLFSTHPSTEERIKRLREIADGRR